MSLSRPSPRQIKTRDDAFRLFAGLARGRQEAFGVAFLSRERTILGLRHAWGREDSVVVPLVRIARDALLLAARAVLIAHSHPDGDTCPSVADLALTRRLSQGLGALDVVLLDHLIVTSAKIVSLREQGLL
ncbi:DNA repair protein [Sphingomonas sanguinis]|jgi:DNA repair protein RadC|uniref:JAB domain-containing protein n=1 Tax=Sphingomonas sp. LC-1 TaxID=3110957 RepID=UPI0021BACBCD|nr:JAB domain-containing protein [Sphingomonas sp. LC-1]MCT8001357.1 DNA repair protein [Sphingomonas sp. LC-1]